MYTHTHTHSLKTYIVFDLIDGFDPYAEHNVCNNATFFSISKSSTVLLLIVNTHPEKQGLLF